MTSTTTAATQFATSADGTSIAYEVTGEGPALVLADGALCSRAMGPSRGLTSALAQQFRVFSYDRRHRGESGPGASPYSTEREVEDLAAVIDAAGGIAHIFGASSGAVLALEAARVGVPMDRLALYEAPFIVDDTHPGNDPQLAARLETLVSEGRRGEAVKTFLRTVGAPAPVVAMMRILPVWKKLTDVAHTLPYDVALVAEHRQGRPLPEGYYDAVTPETLVLAGAKSPEYMRNAQAAIAETVPTARLEVLPKQTHMIKAKVVAPVLVDFLTA